MALKDIWQNLIDGESEIVVAPLNEMAHAIIKIEEDFGKIDTALDELHTYAQALVNGGNAQ